MFSRALLLFAMVFAISAVPAFANTPMLSGNVVDDGRGGIAHASIVLRGASSVVQAKTDAAGSFQIVEVTAGTYSLTVAAPGYQPLRDRIVRVPAFVTVVLRPSTASALNVISSVTVGAKQGVSSSSTPARAIDRAILAATTSGKLSDVLGSEPALMPSRPAGGGSNAPYSVALRGPDPTETLVEIDGHQINTGVNGTFDLSLIDPQALDTVELVYGIAPSSLVGPDTIGGAVNIRTLEPTPESRSYARAALGSFDTSMMSIESTGTKDGLGYAVAFDRYASNGDVNANGSGSSALAGTALAKLRLAVDRNRGFIQATLLDQASNRDVSAALSSFDADGNFTSFAGSSAQAHDTLYGVDLQVPIGRTSADGLSDTTLTLRHANETDAQSVNGPAANFSEFFFNYRDASMDDSVQLDRTIGRGTLTAKYDMRTESLFAPYTLGGVTDTSVRRALDTSSGDAAPTAFSIAEADHSFALRYLVEPTAHLHYSGAVYSSNFGSFGYSMDPRFGFAWTPTQQTALRASVGTTFQAPLLTELYVPSPLPPVDANGSDGLVAIGNPNLRPDRATEYDLGMTHILGVASHALSLSADLYQTNLRNAIEQYVPPHTPAYTFPINLGDVEYRGIELQADKTIASVYHVQAGFVVNSAFPVQVPNEIQSGSLVSGQQFLGTPLHRSSLRILRANTGRGISFASGLIYEGAGNELNRPPFALIDARVTESFDGFDFTLSATNVTNVYEDRFTLNGLGTPYAGSDGPIATSAYSLPARTVTFSISHAL